MAASKKATKKTAKPVEQQLYAVNSTNDESLSHGTLEEMMDELNTWDWWEEETVTLYKLVPYKKYKTGQRYVEIK